MTNSSSSRKVITPMTVGDLETFIRKYSRDLVLVDKNGKPIVAINGVAGDAAVALTFITEDGTAQ